MPTIPGFFARSALAAAVLVLLFAAMAAGDEPQPEPETEYFNGALFGWGHDSEGNYHFAAPLYSHHYHNENDRSLTLIYPLLSAHYRGEFSEEATFDGVAAGPLLALLGAGARGNRSAAGFFSPYLAAGDLEWERDEQTTAQAFDLSLLPWLPLAEDFLNFRLYSSSRAAGVQGEAAFRDYFSLPGLDFYLYKRRNLGIEKETRFLSLWNFSLYRHVLDMPGGGMRPWQHGFQTDWLVQAADLFGTEPDERDIEDLADTVQQQLQEGRSGNPRETTAFLDPIFVYQQQGEDVTGLGFEPLFYYDQDEGFSLPWLLSAFTDEGYRFGAPAFRHLFPLVHGNAASTRYDLLAGLGTVHLDDDYQAVDLKLLFNWQRHEKRGSAWGVLPFFREYYPGQEIDPGTRFVQLPGHAFSWWDLPDHRGMELLAPLVFAYDAAGGEETGAGQRRLSIGPFGLLYRSRWIPGGEARTRVLWLFGFDSKADHGTFDFCGLELFDY